MHTHGKQPTYREDLRDMDTPLILINGVLVIQHMRYTIASVLFVSMIAWMCHTQSSPAAAKHEPNGGYVSDAEAAKDVAQVVLSRLLTSDRLWRTKSADAVLTNGVWTVWCFGPKTEIQLLKNAIVIQIRQKTGAIIKYEDPKA